mmetsp:Transcript_6751/g.17652  ORF Transcript_6751/g.17652 Transcript_6751/m.17652 type:complete len:211 (+) Transcript_6751:962-1594(+)
MAHVCEYAERRMGHQSWADAVRSQERCAWPGCVQLARRGCSELRDRPKLHRSRRRLLRLPDLSELPASSTGGCFTGLRGCYRRDGVHAEPGAPCVRWRRHAHHLECVDALRRRVRDGHDISLRGRGHALRRRAEHRAAGHLAGRARFHHDRRRHRMVARRRADADWRLHALALALPARRSDETEQTYPHGGELRFTSCTRLASLRQRDDD